jgi:hypothetical protein
MFFNMFFNRRFQGRGFVVRAIGFGIAVLFSAPAFSAETIKYLALVDGGKEAGHQTVVVGDDGITRVDFIFKDNGRGPELKEEYVLAADGTFATYSVKGTSTFGAPVDEQFRIENGKAIWKSTSDAGRYRCRKAPPIRRSEDRRRAWR